MKKIFYILCALVFFVGCASQKTETQKPDTTKTEATKTETVNTDKDVRDTLAKFVEGLNTLSLTTKFIDPQSEVYDISKGNSVYMWWIADDDSNIFVKDVTYSATYVPVSDKTQLKNIIDSADKTMFANNFKLNTKNSSASVDDDKFYDYVRAYDDKTKNIICTLTQNNDETTDVIPSQKDVRAKLVVFSCSNKLQKFYDEQYPFLKALKGNQPPAEGMDSGYVVTRITDKVGDYVMIDVGLRRTGNYAMLKKEGNDYMFIHAGQDIPPCGIDSKIKCTTWDIL